MIKSLGLLFATYAVTIVLTYAMAQSPVPLILSYGGYVCDGGSTFHPLDGVTVCGLFVAFLSAYLLGRFLVKRPQVTITAVSVMYHWKMLTLFMIGGATIYKAFDTLTADCTTILSDYSVRHISSFVIVYSVLYASTAHLFFDLRRYRFESEGWRPR